MTIQMNAVESSNIAFVGHDPETSTLHVQFKTGATYEYKNISTELYQQLLTADSVGGFFARNIKGLPFTKLP